jgi:hypothetical protein
MTIKSVPCRIVEFNDWGFKVAISDYLERERERWNFPSRNIHNSQIT